VTLLQLIWLHQISLPNLNLLVFKLILQSVATQKLSSTSLVLMPSLSENMILQIQLVILLILLKEFIWSL
jgi:hypothetical protein